MTRPSVLRSEPVAVSHRASATSRFRGSAYAMIPSCIAQRQGALAPCSAVRDRASVGQRQPSRLTLRRCLGRLVAPAAALYALLGLARVLLGLARVPLVLSRRRLPGVMAGVLIAVFLIHC